METGESEILLFCSSAMRACDDMIDLKGRRDQHLWNPAIFATKECTSSNEFVEGPDPSSAQQGECQVMIRALDFIKSRNQPRFI